MFDNIGGKIKTLASVMCWIGIVSSIGGGITLWVLSDGRSGVLIVLGFVVMIVGSLLSWAGSFIIYGFGQLIEDNHALREKLAPEQIAPKKESTEAAQKMRNVEAGSEEESATESDDPEHKKNLIIAIVSAVVIALLVLLVYFY